MMANRNAVYSNSSPSRQPGVKCNIILQKCLAIQLHKTGAIPFQPGPGGRTADAGDYWMYDNGYLLFQVSFTVLPPGGKAADSDPRESTN